MPQESLDDFLSGRVDTLGVVLVEGLIKFSVEHRNGQRGISKILLDSLFGLIRLLGEDLESTFLSLDQVIVEALQVSLSVRIL